MDCTRAEELFSDHLEGGLHPILARELEAHLAGCARCRELRGALGEVVELLRGAPLPQAPPGLAERAARAALVARVPRPALPHPPQWLNAAAAGFALIALGAALAVIGPERGTRAAQRLVGETVSRGSSLIERKDRLVEDVRVLGVVLSTAFEGRIERVNERVNDYRRLIEKRRPEPSAEPKERRESRATRSRVAAVFRTPAEPGS